jgi:hypothetical protein
MKTRKDKTYSYEHTKVRALERYGIELTPAIYDEWNALCGYSTRIQVDKSNQQVVHVIEWRGQEITVVQNYVPSEKVEPYIRTVLPRGTKLMFGKDTRRMQNQIRVSDWYKQNGKS